MSPYADPAKNAACVRDWRERHPEREPGYKLSKRYGIGVERYVELLDLQGGLCAICSTEPGEGRYERLYVDHDHETGAVRGLLCFACNRALGAFKDDPERLRNAILYLEGEE